MFGIRAKLNDIKIKIVANEMCRAETGELSSVKNLF